MWISTGIQKTSLVRTTVVNSRAKGEEKHENVALFYGSWESSHISLVIFLSSLHLVLDPAEVE